MQDRPHIYPTLHHQQRRAWWHDYRAPAVYMVTLRALPEIPPFGSLMDFADPRQARIELSDLGQAISNSILDLGNVCPKTEILRHVIMPDHCHILIRVKEKLQDPFGKIIRGLKAGISSDYGTTVFDKGFNDRIVRNKRQLLTLYAYIESNPFRLAVRRLHPALFRRHLSITVNNRKMEAYGNIFLLRDYDILPVIIRSKYTQEEKQQLHDRWLRCATNNGVLISAFISKEEKTIRDEAIEAGARIIQIYPNGLPERFKPSGTEFQLCSEGRLLILSPWPYNPEEKKLTRGRSLAMNLIASEIAVGHNAARLHLSP